jgi:hypothetical protein
MSGEMQIKSSRVDRLRTGAAEMEAMLKEEGFEDNGTHGVFVRWQRQTIEDLGDIITDAEKMISVKVGGLCERIENSMKTLESVQLVQLDGLFKGAEQVLVMARESVTAAMMVKEQIAVKTDYAIAGIAKTMGGTLLDETQKWFLEAQKERLRKESWRLGIIVAGVLMVIMAVGYEVRAWQDDPAVTALERCAAAPLWVQIGDDQQPVPACRLDDVARRNVKDLPLAVKEWVGEWLP